MPHGEPEVNDDFQSLHGPTLFWRSGQRVEVTPQEWAETVPNFLGSGFRVQCAHQPPTNNPLEFSRQQVSRIAQVLGTEMDPTPWEELAKTTFDVVGFEITGGWAYGLDRRWGPAWTAVTTGGVFREGVRHVASVTLPWAYSSDSPLAGLPMLSRLEADKAQRFLDTTDAEVGLWWNHRDELCTTTAGPPLVRTQRGSWVFPDRSSGIDTHWAFSSLASELAAMPVTVTRDTLNEVEAIYAVSPLGNLTALNRIDAVPRPIAPTADQELRRHRDALRRGQ